MCGPDFFLSSDRWKVVPRQSFSNKYLITTWSLDFWGSENVKLNLLRHFWTIAEERSWEFSLCLLRLVQGIFFDWDATIRRNFDWMLGIKGLWGIKFRMEIELAFLLGLWDFVCWLKCVIESNKLIACVRKFIVKLKGWETTLFLIFFL